jgi:ferrous iron transport protein B
MKWLKRGCCISCASSDEHSSSLKIGLVGNPNCGKTTVFNALTGACQQVGNWPGVTVEKKTGCFNLNKTSLEVIDLPGIYSLTLASQEAGIDERVSCDFILNYQSDVILNIVDASNLERHLYLTLQLLELGVPVIVGLNMMDVAQQRGLQVDVERLATALGCPVIPIVARSGDGVMKLKQALAGRISPVQCLDLPYPDLIREAVHLFPQGEKGQRVALKLLEGDVSVSAQVSPEVLAYTKEWQVRIANTLGEDADILIADARYRFIQSLYEKCVTKRLMPVSTWTSRIDSVVLNRVGGIPIFLLVMYSLFFFAINVGGAFQDFFDISSNTLLVEGLGHSLQILGTPNWLVALLANGVGKGINTILTFIPVIGAMFFGLAFLEDSGYMTRAAFIIDRLMRVLGLPGKSFVPMIVGFGCNVPAVMAARTLENPRDRILTVMMTPFMSCSARLAIYAVFIAAFFPSGGQNIVFGLYLLGIFMAVLTGWVLRKTVLKGKPSPLIMELPPYRMPTFRILMRHAWQRLSGFVWRAGKLILPICILLGVLNALNVDGTLNHGEGNVHSILSQIGQWLTPLFSPMGVHMDNWPATVGLVTGILAKEVVVGTLNSLYGQIGQLTHVSGDTFYFWANLKAALLSIPQNLSQLSSALTNPMLAQAPIHTLNQSVYGVMARQFDGTIGAIAYLLFVLLYFPCVSTVAAMSRELNRYWAAFSVLWTTGLAYGVAVGFYQVATRCL